MHPLIFPALAATLLLTSCETTGDPSQGGLFGWSSNKADQRSAALNQHLQDVDADTAYQKGRSAALEQKKAQKQRELNAAQ
jgi:hypothetical protein